MTSIVDHMISIVDHMTFIVDHMISIVDHMISIVDYMTVTWFEKWLEAGQRNGHSLSYLMSLIQCVSIDACTNPRYKSV